ncbi:hypothetical protein BKA82DRAFT_4019265 [Pisolithus tinctorius]|nr:hypothetical protein BKA82DRAFT_4019265 [Pisolithus tinctorius]
MRLSAQQYLTSAYFDSKPRKREVVGLLLAVFRFWFRYRIQRLWWEDAWAFAAFLFAITYLTGTWLDVLYRKPTSTVGFWMYVFSFNPVIWYEIASSQYCKSKDHRGKARLLFFLLFISFMTAKLWYYCHDLSWMNNTLYFGNALLPLGTNLTIFELTTDFITDAILIALPIRFLWSVKLPTRQRRMILLIFASGITITLAAIFRATCQLLGLNLIVSLVMDAELRKPAFVRTQIAFSTIMCNLLVFVTFLYRYSRSASPPPSTDSDENDDYTTPVRPRQTTQLLTMVEVGGSDYCSDDATSTWRDGCSSQATSGTHSSSEQQQPEKTSS